ncbi:hypothetical protein DPV73_07235 [Leptospira mayottensis]|nr:hypothetical protein [Leptospira mayottensis]AXR67840.1 hypothetical protein DPV73_07235 [Leptospira mayottensis]
MEREVEDFEFEYQVQQPQKLTQAFKQTDHLVSIPIPGDFMAWSGGINSLRGATSYDTNQILAGVYLG